MSGICKVDFFGNQNKGLEGLQQDFVSWGSWKTQKCGCQGIAI